MSARGRKALPGVEPVDGAVDSQALAAANAASHEVNALDRAVADAGEVYRLVGRIEAAHFLETVSSRLIAEAYIAARAALGKTGSIVVQRQSGKTETVSSLEDFCDAVMPFSARRCRQIVSALDTLGAELYEQAERIGFRARDYQALRALPADDQAAVKAAIESGDKDVALDLITDLAARNAALRTKVEEADKLLVAKDKVIAKKDAKLNKLAEEAELRSAIGTDEAATLQGLRDATVSAEIALAQLGATVGAALNGAPSEAVATAARQAGEYIAQRLADTLAAHGIPVDLEQMVTPAWLSAGADLPVGETAMKPRKR